ncbi:MAG: aminotransferase class III-fold pyridoxal phosphate-dependent enzyme [Actinobacteria bacterium]|nr:MAG: aminotransferase class III-fold pyridoxal phosphate-dependent enzyme [Actinomycetota bacterium]
MPVDRAMVKALLQAESERFAAEHRASRARFEQAQRSLLGGVPMTWMAKWAGGHPLFAARAGGAWIEDVDGRRYVDFALGDTGAMAGHSPAPVVDAVARRLGELGGATVMLPTDDAAWVGDELTRRFGVPLWSFSLTATDANRWALRLCRAITGRPYVLVFSHCYHGTVDETFVTLNGGGRPRSRAGNVGPAVDPTVTTRVCEFNDLDAVERLLADKQVACVLTEPALTNIGIVLPEPGFLDGVRAACDWTGTLLICDETHTLSAGPGGCTDAWGLTPDVVTLGKSIAGGLPIGAYGVSADVGARIEALEDADHADLVDVGGVGGTLAGNALSLAAARATLSEVLTADAFAGMTALCDRFVAGVHGALFDHDVPWSIVQLGARAELAFGPEPPRNGGASAALHDAELEDALHLYLLNRGVLITPFHNMALMSPATTEADVDRHTEVFAELLAAITAP